MIVGYMIDPVFRNFNSLFILSFKLGRNMATGITFDRHYLPLLEIKDFILLINIKPFFYQPIKNKQEPCEKLVEMFRNNDFTTGILSYYLYHQKYYRLIGTDLSRQI